MHAPPHRYRHVHQRCTDLRVLGKGDFRHLIKWRLRMVKYRDELKALEGKSDDEAEGDEGEEGDGGAEVAVTEEEKEEEVQAEIRALQ